MFLGYVWVNTALACLPIVIFTKVNKLASYDTLVIDLRAYIRAWPTYIQGGQKKPRHLKKLHYSAKNYPNKMPLGSDIAYICRYYHADFLVSTSIISEIMDGEI